ncbi:hypothetical protein INT43_000401 [Umbelopsis isabellina]|uniref:N-terminal Ras-GEF domain-containing protein n=1 Tax=Mortierella isabellina TaxID=91625 RepID=A0A8H7UJX7_MORIS|nr:hypothetical protein INT43_000401 [Umbelopsis isabellina]
MPRGVQDLPKVDGGLICFDLTNKDSMDCLPDLLSKEIFPLCVFPRTLCTRTLCQTIKSTFFPMIRTFPSFQYSRRLVEICANIVLSCAGKRQDIDFEPLRTLDLTINKQPSKPTLRERRLIGEPTMKIGTNTHYSNKQIGYGKHSPKNLAGLWTASSPPDHDQQHIFDSIRSPQPQASKSMPAARNRIEQHANGGDRTPNTSLSSSHISPTFPGQTTTGFVYAPTKSVHDTSSHHLPSPSFKPLPSLPRHHAKSSFSDQTSILDSISNMTSVTSDSKMNKRNSKDSGESFSPGMTIEDIIDRLTQSTGPATDEKFSLIFMTFFRRFMRPRELVELLTERFGNDVSAKKLPTPQQNKIHEFLCQWLSTYWGDFSSVQTRKLLMLHLEVLSQHTDLRPMCDDLAPLIIREPPCDDPDTRWGLIDIEDSTQEPSTPATHYSSEVMEFGKKDSGYVGSFDSAQFLDIHSPVLQSMAIDSDQSHNVDNGVRKQLPEIPSKTTSNAINSHRGRNVAHMHSASHSRYHDPMKPKSEGIYERNKWQQEFAGGLVNIDNHARHGPNSSAASIMSQLAGGARPEKDLAQSCFKTFAGFSEEALADQLTWIEAELFYRIKVHIFAVNAFG